MNPSFYPKHLARQYAQNGALRNQNEGHPRIPNFERPWAQVYPLPGGENSHSINNNNNKYGDQQQVVIDGQVQEQQTVGNMRRVENHQVPNIPLSTCGPKNDATSGGRLQVPKNSAVFNGLPPTFIEAMKKLFDMVDANGEGRVRLEDIAQKWSPNSNDTDEHLPKGIVASLKKVTTADGYLTFERFCAGLKIAILRHESEKKKKRRNNSSFDSTQTSESDSSGCSSVDNHNKNISEQNSPVSVTSSMDSSPASDVISVLNRGMVSKSRYDDQDAELDEEMQRISSNGDSTPFSDRLSRTNSLPNLQGMETHPGRGGAPLQIGFHEDFIDTQYHTDDIRVDSHSKRNTCTSFVPTNQKKITGPSPCPSEPSYSTSSAQLDTEQFPKMRRQKTELGIVNMRRHQSHNVIPTGPPKPPRDPSKRMSGHFMTSAYSLASLPTSTAASIPLSMTNNMNPNKESKQHNHDETKFIWKEPPNSQIETSKEEIKSEKSADIKEVVVRTRGVGGPVHKRKDMHHTRRHTLQGGVDFSMIKRLKQWEEEKSVLEEGLKATKVAYEWYKLRLEGVSERLRKGPEPSSTPAANTEAMQERLMFELNSIRELNHRLSRLMDLSTGQKQYIGGESIQQSNLTDDKNPNAQHEAKAHSQGNYGFPTHMNLELTKTNSTQNSFHQQNALLLERQVQRLKEQNKQLTHEVGQKSNQVTALEQEKRTLIKQLFHRPNTSASTIQNNKSSINSITRHNHLSHDSRRKGGSQSMNNILSAPSQTNNRNFDSAKSSARNTFVGSGPAIFKSAASLHQQQQF